MPAPSVTNTFVNGTTASATDVNQNFTDIINALTDGLKDITISSLSTATSAHSGTATFNGNVVLGNASTDTVTLTATMTSSTEINITKTTNQLVLGTTNTTTINSIAPAASRVYTIPDAGAAASFVMTQGTQTIAGALTLSSTLAVSGTISCVDITSTGSINALNKTTTNYIMNGNFDIWQRGTSFTALANGSYGPDRWLVLHSSDAVCDVLRSADVPAMASTVTGGTYSAQVDVTTADASIAAGQYYLLSQRIEGLVYQNIHSKQVTLNFWVYATKTGTYCVSFQNSATNRSYVAEYTVSSTNTWEKKTVTLTLDTSGTWLYTNGIGLRVSFAIACGSTFQTTAGAWAAGNYFATSSQVNGLDSTSNNFKLSQVQLELGDQATPFKPFGGSFMSDLMACLRYAYSPSQTSLDSSLSASYYIMYNVETNVMRCTITLPVPLRSTPTLSNVTESTNFNVRNLAGSNVTGFALTVGNYGNGVVQITATQTSHGQTAGFLLLYVGASATILTSEL